MLRVWAVLFVILAGAASPDGATTQNPAQPALAPPNATLQPPPPGGGVSGHDQKPQSGPSQQETGASQQGTNQNPLVVNIGRGPEPQPPTEEQRKEREKKASEDRWTLIYVCLTALFTGALAIIGVGQLYMFYRQLGFMREGMDDAKIAAEAARDAAQAGQTHRSQGVGRHLPAQVGCPAYNDRSGHGGTTPTYPLGCGEYWRNPWKNSREQCHHQNKRPNDF
jgi:hypothetical protein